MTRLRMRIRSVALAAVIALLGLGAGPQSAFADSSSPTPSPDTVTLRIGVTGDADTLNPNLMLETLSFETVTMTYNLLFDLDLEGQPRNQLAAEIPTLENGGISADGKIWTIKLRPEMKWSDGEPLTAADVAWTLEYYRVNIDLLPNMSLAMAGIERTTAVDDTTVEIGLSAPRADLLYGYLPILPEHIWKDVPADLAGSVYENEPPIVGSGPFTIVEWKPGSFLRMERNPHYWGPEPDVDEIIYSVYTNPETMAADLEAGTIDAAHGFLPAQYERIGALPDVEAIAYNYRNWDYLCLNCYEGEPSTGHPVLLDPAFRNALNWAVDREKLAEIAYYGFAEPATTIMTPDTWTDPDWHLQPAEDAVYAFDLEKAGQLLDAAGYTKGAGGTRQYEGEPIALRFWVLSDSIQEQTAGKLITGWFRELGLKVKLEVIDTGALVSRVYNYKGATYAPDFDMFIWYWDGFSDPSFTLSTFQTDALGGNNEPGWSNAEFDRLWLQQAQELDPAVRQELIWRMQEIFYEEAPHMALVYPRYLQAYNTGKWEGWARVQNGTGPVIWAVDNQDTYVNLKPATAEGDEEVGGSGGLWAAVIAAAVAFVGVVVVVMLRRRRKAEEE